MGVASGARAVRERVSEGVSLGNATDERVEELAVAAAAQSTLFAYRGTSALHALRRMRASPRAPSKASG